MYTVGCGSGSSSSSSSETTTAADVVVLGAKCVAIGSVADECSLAEYGSSTYEPRRGAMLT